MRPFLQLDDQMSKYLMQRLTQVVLVTRGPRQKGKRKARHGQRRSLDLGVQGKTVAEALAEMQTRGRNLLCVLCLHRRRPPEATNPDLDAQDGVVAEALAENLTPGETVSTRRSLLGMPYLHRRRQSEAPRRRGE